MQNIDASQIRVIDISSTILPPEEPFGPDQISTRVLDETLIYPLKKFQSAIDDSTYLMVTLKSHLGTHVECPITCSQMEKILLNFQLKPGLEGWYFLNLNSLHES